jgi:hypothetical protein
MCFCLIRPSETFRTLMEYDYPYGETSFAGNNSAFYLSGQFGDVLYEISKIRSDNEGPFVDY